MNGGCHCIQNRCHHTAVTACLFLQSGDHPKVDILNRDPIEIGVKKKIQFQDRLVVHFLIQIDDLVPDCVVVTDNHCHKLKLAHPRQLDELDLVAAVLRNGNHGSIVGIGSKNLRNLLKHLIHLICLLNDQISQLCNLRFLLLHQLIDVKSVAFI